MKNHIPDGEVVLCYADGQRKMKFLVPPFSLDCYFQHFSQEGTSVALGELPKASPGRIRSF